MSTASITSVVPRRLLGGTGLYVSIVGLGGVEIGEQQAPVRAVDRLLGMALDSGVNVIDTAECYFNSEEMIGRVLRGNRKDWLLFTKCGHNDPYRPRSLFVRAGRKLWRGIARTIGRRHPDWDPRLLACSIDRSLHRLKTDWIDLMQLHSCSKELLERGEMIEVLQRARDAGKVRYIGYSGDGEAALFALQCGHFDTLQISISIADQQAVALTVPQAQQRGMGVIAKRPIANAVWTNEQRPENSYHHAYWDRLQELRYGFLRTPCSFGTALRFTLTVPGVHTAIPGTANPNHFRQNIQQAGLGPLEEEQYRTIRTRWHAVASPDWVGQP